jgi:hypothetical protein
VRSIGDALEDAEVVLLAVPGQQQGDGGASGAGQHARDRSEQQKSHVPAVPLAEDAYQESYHATYDARVS